MRMQLTLSDFDMARFDDMKTTIAKFAQCQYVVANQGDGSKSVTVLCNASMVQCMCVVAVTDRYWGGDHSYDLHHNKASG